MQTVIFENQYISMEILPSCGGKIRNLVSKSSGRQWLWHNPSLEFQTPQYGDSYITKLDNGGWDEIFPSIQPCRVPLSGNRQMNIPDHGDVVALPASVQQPDPQTLVTTTRGRCADFEFVRQIRLYGSMIVLNYMVTNTGICSFPFLWSAHPLIRFEAGMKINLERITPFTVDSAFGDIPFRAGDSFLWSGFDGSKTIPEPADMDFAPFAIKFFSDAHSVQAITVISADRQESLTFSWETPFIRHLGIWMNCGGWSGTGEQSACSYSLGVEPTTSPFDDLTKARQKNMAILLEPGECREWSMKIAIEQYNRPKYYDFKREQHCLLKQTEIHS